MGANTKEKYSIMGRLEINSVSIQQLLGKNNAA